jgi:hypothetical protein
MVSRGIKRKESRLEHKNELVYSKWVYSNWPIQKHRCCACQNPYVLIGKIDMVKISTFVYV